jgi:excisionase family DNA binding protein
MSRPALAAVTDDQATRGPITLDEIKCWPAVVSVETAAAALGVSRSYAYELARSGSFPCKIVTVGSRVRVVTSSLVELLSSTAGGGSVA